MQFLDGFNESPKSHFLCFFDSDAKKTLYYYSTYNGRETSKFTVLFYANPVQMVQSDRLGGDSLQNVKNANFVAVYRGNSCNTGIDIPHCRKKQAVKLKMDKNR